MFEQPMIYKNFTSIALITSLAILLSCAEHHTIHDTTKIVTVNVFYQPLFIMHDPIPAPNAVVTTHFEDADLFDTGSFCITNENGECNVRLATGKETTLSARVKGHGATTATFIEPRENIKIIVPRISQGLERQIPATIQNISEDTSINIEGEGVSNCLSYNTNCPSTISEDGDFTISIGYYDWTAEKELYFVERIYPVTPIRSPRIYTTKTDLSQRDYSPIHVDYEDFIAPDYTSSDAIVTFGERFFRCSKIIRGGISWLLARDRVALLTGIGSRCLDESTLYVESINFAYGKWAYVEIGDPYTEGDFLVAGGLYIDQENNQNIRIKGFERLSINHEPPHVLSIDASLISGEDSHPSDVEIYAHLEIVSDMGIESWIIIPKKNTSLTIGEEEIDKMLAIFGSGAYISRAAVVYRGGFGDPVSSNFSHPMQGHHFLMHIYPITR